VVIDFLQSGIRDLKFFGQQGSGDLQVLQGFFDPRYPYRFIAVLLEVLGERRQQSRANSVAGALAPAD
jgi:hypothetical protein